MCDPNQLVMIPYISRTLSLLLPMWYQCKHNTRKLYHIEIHTLGLYVSGNSYIVETVYSVTISIQTEQRLT